MFNSAESSTSDQGNILVRVTIKVSSSILLIGGGRLMMSISSRMGYGSLEGPGPGEVDLPSRCAEQGFWQYSLIQAVLPHGRIDTYELDVKRTVALVRRLAMQDAIEKIFLEPHLKERWRLQEYGKIRFQGCHSVRHDDHIHLQIH